MANAIFNIFSSCFLGEQDLQNEMEVELQRQVSQLKRDLDEQLVMDLQVKEITTFYRFL